MKVMKDVSEIGKLVPGDDDDQEYGAAFCVLSSGSIMCDVKHKGGENLLGDNAKEEQKLRKKSTNNV